MPVYRKNNDLGAAHSSTPKISEKNFNTTVPYAVRVAKLPGKSSCLYGDILRLSKRTGFCFAGSEFLAAPYEVSVRTVERWIKRLAEAGFLLIEGWGRGRHLYPLYDLDGPIYESVGDAANDKSSDPDNGSEGGDGKSNEVETSPSSAATLSCETTEAPGDSSDVSRYGVESTSWNDGVESSNVNVPKTRRSNFVLDERNAAVTEMIALTGDRKSKLRWQQIHRHCILENVPELWDKAIEILRRRIADGVTNVNGLGAVAEGIFRNLFVEAGVPRPARQHIVPGSASAPPVPIAGVGESSRNPHPSMGKLDWRGLSFEQQREWHKLAEIEILRSGGIISAKTQQAVVNRAQHLYMQSAINMV